MEKWKAVRLKAGAPLELFDLQADPPAHPDIVEKIETYLKTARTPSERWPGK
jgi:hypothetical protein